MINEANNVARKTPDRSLIAYLSILVILCAGFIVGAKAMGEKGLYLAQAYMLTPALAAVLTRLFFYRNKFSDARLRLGKVKDYFRFWLFSLLIAAASFLVFYLIGAIKWDFTGETFLKNLAEQFKNSGQDINSGLPEGVTPKTMMWLLMAGQLTVLNIVPGLITGFGEEFGHRGFMYTRLKEHGFLLSIIVGGLIWFAWHLPLQLLIPAKDDFSTTQTILNYFILAIGSVCTFAYLVYVFEKSQSIWVVSLAHIVINNASAAFSYFIILQNQFLANAGLTITMLLVLFFGPGHYLFKIFKQQKPDISEQN